MARLKKKKNGAVAYTLALVAYTLILLVLAFFALTQIWNFAERYEAARPSNTMDAYIERLSANLWDDSIASTIASMPHEVQTDEECKELVKTMLSDELSYSRQASKATDDTIKYNLLCGGNVFGSVTLVRDTSDADTEPTSWAFLNELLADQYPWVVQSEEFDFNGLYTSVEAVVPESYSVQLNGVTLSDKYIVERDIPYDVLEDYYDQYPNLPKKVKYRYDDAFGHLTPVILNEQGEVTQIDTTKDDSQFIKPVDPAILSRLEEFSVNFANNYLAYCAGVYDPMYAYSNLLPFIEQGGDFDSRLKQAMDGYSSWSHTTSYRFDSASLNKATDVGGGFYILEISAVTTTTFPNHGENGVVTTNNGLSAIVQDKDGEIRAVAVERYDANEQ